MADTGACGSSRRPGIGRDAASSAWRGQEQGGAAGPASQRESASSASAAVPRPGASPLDRRVIGVGGVVFAVLMALSARYGFHRDELYMLDCARHLQASYVDQPVLAPLLAWVSLKLFGVSVTGLRVACAGGVDHGGGRRPDRARVRRWAARAAAGCDRDGHDAGLRGRPALDPAGEPPGHPHQVRVIELVIAAAMQPPPPAPEPARVMAQREIRVQHHPVHAIVRTGQQVPVPLSEVIGHPPTVGPGGTLRQPDYPEGATPSGRSPGRSVGHLRCHAILAAGHRHQGRLFLRL